LNLADKAGKGELAHEEVGAALVLPDLLDGTLAGLEAGLLGGAPCRCVVARATVGILSILRAGLVGALGGLGLGLCVRLLRTGHVYGSGGVGRGGRGRGGGGREGQGGLEWLNRRFLKLCSPMEVRLYIISTCDG